MHRRAARHDLRLLALADVAGPCQGGGQTAQSFAEGRTLGSLRMTGSLVGMAMPTAAASGDTAQTLPRDIPEQTNT